MACSVEQKRLWIDPDHSHLSVQRQCQLLGLPRSTYYYTPVGESADNLALMRAIDKLHLECAFFGSRNVAAHLGINRKRAQRLMRLMGIEAIYPKCSLSRPAPGHRVFPYLLRGLEVVRPNQVWCSDITYIPMQRGFLYLVAVMDWYSRFVLSWELSNTLEAAFCSAALDAAFQRYGQPEIWNTDQGAQFTSESFLQPLLDRKIQISMDGRGRALDNVFIERLWRSVKYELIYLHEFASGVELFAGLRNYFPFYNERRLHQGLSFATPAAKYFA